jgi:cell division protein FtsW
MKRSDRSLLTNWWFQIDWWIMGLVVAFCFVGILSGIQSVYLFDKIVLFYGLAAGIFLVVPMLPVRAVIGAAWVLLATCLGLFLLTYLSPHVIHESGRWAFVFGQSLMPADLMKPPFVILTAWFLSMVKRRAPDDWIAAASVWRGLWWPAYIALFLPVLVMMFFHPDLGNMFMYIITFGAMVFWAGAKWRYIFAFGGLGVCAVLTSFLHGHYRARLLGGSDPYQINRSLDAIRNGGLWGRGEESFLFEKIPMNNNDFVFSGIAEMWGALAGVLLLVAMFWMFCLLFRRANQAKDDFASLILFGTAFLFALHVVMNVATATGLFMKGTTLPYISYGGSSLVAFSLLFAAVLGIVRHEKWGGD